MLLVYLLLINADTDMMPPYPSPSPTPPASIRFEKKITGETVNTSKIVFHNHRG